MRVMGGPTLEQYFGRFEPEWQPGGDACGDGLACPVCGRRRRGLYRESEQVWLRCSCGEAKVAWAPGRETLPGWLSSCWMARGRSGSPVWRSITIAWEVAD